MQEKQKVLNKAYEEMESWRKKVEGTKAKAEGLRAKQVCVALPWMYATVLWVQQNPLCKLMGQCQPSRLVLLMSHLHS